MGLGTGGVALFALHLARASGLKVILSSSSDEELARISAQFTSPPLLTVNYKTNPDWHENVLRLTDGEGVELVIEVGGLFYGEILLLRIYTVESDVFRRRLTGT
jgi:NADPH:quinone reductase-like Zn-dependent oxidoreductase